MRAAGDQTKTTCGSLELCAGLEACIKEENHTVAQRWHERTMPLPVLVPEGRAEEEAAD